MSEKKKLLDDQISLEEQENSNELKRLRDQNERYRYLLSHELTGSLRFINMFFDKIRGGIESALPEKDLKILDLMHFTSTRMSDLIANVLNYSKLEKKPVSNNNINLSEILTAIIDVQKKRYEHKSVDVSVDHFPIIQSDKVLLNTVFEILIVNAFKFARNNEQMKIEVGYVDQPENHLFFVKDNGVGFDMKYEKKLFKYFSRLHTENEFEGMGLGLAAAKTMLTKLQGDIWADASLANGAKFCFTLPKTYLEESRKN